MSGFEQLQLQAWIRQLRHSSRFRRVEALRAIEKMGPKAEAALPALRAFARPKNRRLCRRLIRTIKAIRRPAAARTLRQLAYATSCADEARAALRIRRP